MTSRAIKLRFRRRLRMRKLQVEELGQQAEQGLERNFFRRLDRLKGVRRFVSLWLVLIVLLVGCVVAQIGALGTYYKTPQPVPGGRFTEGIIGSFTNANPLYANNMVDSSVSKLLFSGLFTYDQKNNLVGDLAESIAVNERGTTYTVKLKTGLTWHDGKPLTAEDVAFTYRVIQNPDAQSPYRSSWQGIDVKAVDARTVTFTLPNFLSAFPQSLTNGIVPKHILEKESMASLRTVPFNTLQPVGSGPFKFNVLEITGGAADQREEQIALIPFEAYHAGKPNIERFIIHTYRGEEQLLQGLKDREIDAASGLSRVPDELKDDGSAFSYRFNMTAAVMTFFRTSQGILSDGKVRQALVHATDTTTIIKQLSYSAIPVRQALLRGQLGYDPAYSQLGYDLNAARQLLDQQGWIVGADGIRTKGEERFSITLYAQDTSEYANVARQLQKQWRHVGLDLQIVLQDSSDFQVTLSSTARGYDALLYGISIGKDPDVYVYWDSKNADVRSETRLNFSEYKSAIADAALQAGRTRNDAGLRAVKYQPFLQAWRNDAPAVGLYQPRFLYVTKKKIYGLQEHTINSEIDRYNNVQSWMIRVVDTPQTKVQ